MGRLNAALDGQAIPASEPEAQEGVAMAEPALSSLGRKAL